MFLTCTNLPLLATWLLHCFFEEIHHLSTSIILNKMGYHCNLPCCMVFTPNAVGGVGMQHLHHEMEKQQILILIHHLCANTQLGKVFHILLRTYQLWMGLLEPILADTQPCPWISDCWLSQVRQTLNENRIQIQFDLWVIPPI